MCTPLIGYLRRCQPLVKVIAITSPAGWALETVQVAQRKQRRKSFEKMDYTAVEWFMENDRHDGALECEVLVEVFFLTKRDHRARIPRMPAQSNLPPRPLRNLLSPYPAPPRDRAPEKLIEWCPTSHWEGPCLVKGYIRSKPIYDMDGCMPHSFDNWIHTDRGVRRFQTMEMGKAKGVPGEWITKKTDLPRGLMLSSIPLHVWSVVCDSIGHWLQEQNITEGPGGGPLSYPQTRMPPGNQKVSVQGFPPRKVSENKTRTASPGDPGIWEYPAPDLQKGGAWYRARVINLKQAIAGREDAAELFQEGLEALEIHRGNYTTNGPKYLQLLWWEFPKEHREEIRKGASMRFLVDPGMDIIPNSPLTPEQLVVVEKFVEELKSLGVLRKASRPLRRVCPIFVVPKPGQPGEWRCIADMKRGGQNDCCGQDPIYLPSCHDILPQLYWGGWSAVADASKYFHNYPTLPTERDLIGILHPRTGEELWYVGLPMGSVNSPSIACRFGEGVLRLLREECPTFKAASREENTWHTALEEGKYSLEHSHGYTFMWMIFSFTPVPERTARSL